METWYFVLLILIMLLVIGVFMLNKNLIQKKNKLSNDKKNVDPYILPNKINQISRLSSTEQIIEQCLVDIISKPFNFTFSVINIIDLHNFKVKGWHPISQDIEKINPGLWRDENYHKDQFIKYLPKNDIICMVFNSDAILKVIDRKIEVLSGEIEETLIEFDPRLFNEFSHKDLTRLYIPLTSISKNKESFTFGVIEFGFLTKETTILLDNDLINNLKIYIDNVSQVYHRIYIEELIKEIENEIYICNSVTNHQEFLEDALSRIAGYITQCDYAEIDIATYNDNELDWTPSDESVRFNINLDVLLAARKLNFINGSSEREGIFRHVFRTQTTYNCPNVNTDPYYINVYNNINSQLSIPFRSKEKIIGVFTLYSIHKNFSIQLLLKH
ncbi:hypothetical protein GO730_39140 [Spirosoma sp. HMF3257]|uniref:GAF domain-containing protein n=1 Tax=Spirosoma telluris TaxID=2183553 RepID=A0A327NK32_9BACT|nr:hypothetical protein [Spirosoma telluris]RAI72908.1 hypothetical protein HMF3257_39070 [Spirosoma telluris]